MLICITKADQQARILHENKQKVQHENILTTLFISDINCGISRCSSDRPKVSQLIHIGGLDRLRKWIITPSVHAFPITCSSDQTH